MSKSHKNGHTQPQLHPSPTRSRSKPSTPTHTAALPTVLPPWDAPLPVPALRFPIVALLVFSTGILCFANSHDAAFVFDDSEAIIGNQDLEPETPLWELFQHDFWGSKLASNSSHKSYRPLTVLSFRMNYYLAGGRHPRGFHVTNLLLHGVVSVLFTFVFSVLFSGRLVNNAGQLTFAAPKAALLCGLLFTAHPIHTESVAGVVGRADLLCALTFLLAFLVYVRACHAGGMDECERPTRTSWGQLVLSVCLCLMSVLFKEQGITVLGVCSAYDVIVLCKINPLEVYFELLGSKLKKVCPRPSPKPSPTHRSPSHKAHQNNNYTQVSGNWRKSFVLRHVVLAAAGVLILVGRWRVMGSAAPVFQVVDNPHSFVSNFFLRVLNYNYIFALNVWLLLNPWWLCFDWSMGCVKVIDSVHDFRILFVIALWCGVIVLLMRCLQGLLDRDRKVMTLSLALLVVPFLPATNLFFRVGFVIAERILYLSSAGFSMLVIVGMRSLMVNYKLKQTMRVMFLLLLGVFVVRCVQRSSQWHNEKLLFESGALVCPLNAKVHYNIAKIYGDTGNMEYAIEKYRLAIELHPGYDQAMNNLANILKERGELLEAEQLLEQATTIRPEFAAAWMNLGIVQAALQKNVSAEQSYRSALKHRHKYPDCYYNLGNLYLELRRHQEALSAWRNATILKPTHVSAWSNMILLLDNLGRVDELEIVAKEAQAHLPLDASIHYNIGNAFGKAGRYTESEDHFLQAVKLAPHNPSYHSNLGVLYHRWGQLPKAEKYYRQALELDPRSESTRENLLMLQRKMARNR